VQDAQRDDPQANIAYIMLIFRYSLETSRFSCHDDQLAWILRSIWAFVESAVDLLDLKSATYEKMLDFKTKQVAHCEAMNEPLFAPARMRHVVDEFNLHDLAESIMSHDLVPAHDAPSIRSDELRLLTKFLTELLVRESISVASRHLFNGAATPPL
jgi:hypothetical protein